jgi:hypothetical protein
MLGFCYSDWASLDHFIFCSAASGKVSAQIGGSNEQIAAYVR